ncbi:MAG: SDR family NAD(P)-dependent oxidoreductase [Planctomycetota bacterium]|nr:SDR family NAD(P)-dependent oxidoreductase [Planctomycetota bacterium]
MARRDLAGRRFVITGASGGIGKEIAIQLARHAAHSVLVARREERLAEVARQIADDPEAAGKTTFIVGDVTKESVRRAALERGQDEFGGLDGLINNAAVGAFGLFAEGPSERLRQIMEVNFFAAAELTRTALPILREGRQPIIVNIGSILGHRGIPRMSEYCASKFAMQGLSQSLRIELRQVGIDLLMISPGTVETEFYDNVIAGRDGAGWQRGYSVSGEDVARATIKAMRRGKREIFPNFIGRLLVWANSKAPAVVDRVLARYV